MKRAFRSLKVNSWYVNEHRVLEQIAGPDGIKTLKSFKGETWTKQAYVTHVLGPLVVEWVQTRRVRSITQILLSGKLKKGMLFTCDGTFRSKGLSPRSKREAVDGALLRMNLKDFGEPRTLVVKFHPDGLTTSSAWGALAGQPRVFVFGFIQEITQTELIARPYVIGDLIQDMGFYQPRIRDSLEIRPEEFDVFAGIDFNKGPGIDIQALRNISEAKIKRIFASVFNAVDVPKDWGGETCDLFVRNVLLSGKRFDCAFMFKGPSAFHPMELSDCGKNADQIVRLFDTGADVLVLQHCHAVRAAVRKTMNAFAGSDLCRLRRFCIIDGLDTLRILQSQGAEIPPA